MARPFFSKRERAAVIRVVRIVVAFGMAGLAALSFLALASYHPEDPGYYVSTNLKAQNWLGGAGAFLADVLRKTFGIASFFVPVFIAVWAARLLLVWSPGRIFQRWIVALPALLALSAFASSHAAEAVSGGGLGGIVGDYLFSVLGKGAPIDSDRVRLIVGAVLSLALSVSFALWSIGARHRDAAAIVGKAWDHLALAAVWAFDRSDRAATRFRERQGPGIGTRIAAAVGLGGVFGGGRLATAGGDADWETGTVRETAPEPKGADEAGHRWVGRLTERFRSRAAAPEPQMSGLSVPRAPRESFDDNRFDVEAPGPREPSIGPESLKGSPASRDAGSSFSALDDEALQSKPTARKPFGDLFDDPFEEAFERHEPGFATDGEHQEGSVDADDWLKESNGAPESAESLFVAEEPAEDLVDSADAKLVQIDDGAESDASVQQAPEPDLSAAPDLDGPAEEPVLLKDFAPADGTVAAPTAAASPLVAPVSRNVPTAPQRAAQNPAPARLPSVSLLSDPEPEAPLAMSEQSLAERADQLQAVLNEYGVRGDIIDVHPGPVVSQFELEPAPGLKAARVVGLADDIARSMFATSARVARIPGRNTIGIELPNESREIVTLRGLLEDPSYRDAGHALPLALGRDIAGAPFTADLAGMPHLLIGGATGSGKSVAINTMLLSLLYSRTPEETRLILIDPKMLELSVYNAVPHLLAPVVTDPKKAVSALKWVVREMEERYQKMARLNVRSLDSYNQKAREAQALGEPIERQVQTGFDDVTGEPIYERQEIAAEPMPYIVVVIDEMADLMMVAGKEIEHCVQRLAQMARASGIHLIMATQRPSVDVITGVIKANFPIRISFQVTSKFDSRTILGESGSEQLLGKGDMLFTAGGGRLQRLHGPFVSDEEVESVVAELQRSCGGPREHVDFDAPEPDLLDRAGAGDVDLDDGSDEALYIKAVDIVARERRASTSFIQRRLQIGYNRAARLIELMEEAGIVSPANRVGKREVLVGEPS